MSAFPTPFVAIIGGFWKIKDDAEKFAEAKKTAAEFGAALANAEMGLVVYFSNDESLEPHVVSGYVQALPGGVSKELIRVRFAESQASQVKFVEQKERSKLFKVKNFAGNDWEAPFYRSLVAEDGVDAVFLMAGDVSTLIAGQIALARPIQVLAADNFGGAAAKIRSELGVSHPSWRTHTPEESVAWLKERLVERATQQQEVRLQQELERKEADTQKEQLQERVRKLESQYVKMTSRKKRTVWAAVAFAAFLGAVYFGVSQKSTVELYPFLTILGLVLAGATGALGRSVMSKAEETDPGTSLVLGGIAGFVVGIAYLLPQLIGAPGPWNRNETKFGPYDEIQFISSVLISISAGVGFDTVFARLQEQAGRVDTGPPGKPPTPPVVLPKK